VEEQPESKTFEASSRKRTHGGKGFGLERKIDLPGILVGILGGAGAAKDGDGETAASASQNRWPVGAGAGGWRLLSLSAGRRAAK
jgi:hypothetical protein